MMVAQILTMKMLARGVRQIMMDHGSIAGFKHQQEVQVCGIKNGKIIMSLSATRKSVIVGIGNRQLSRYILGLIQNMGVLN
jgi:hypothetical protein